MGENMNYPENPIDFIKQYSFSDKQRVYTNGSELISVFRVGQMIEHYMSDLTPQQIKDMQFCLREKSRECAELRRELQELKKRDMAWECLKDKVRRKLNLIRKGAPMSRKEEGYEAALLAVLSMIHELKVRRNENA